MLRALAACLLTMSAALLADSGGADAPGFQTLSGEERVAKARTAREEIVRAKFRAVALRFPPREIFLRAFKREGLLEVWARGRRKRFRLVASYAVLKNSGAPGPKRREGDRQVPEGFYEIDRFNPESEFHLSLGLNYPNAADRILSDAGAPGGDIFIHGSDVSIGCVPVGDAAIEEIFLIALAARAGGQQRMAVHIFPARMSGAKWRAFRDEQVLANPALKPFWEQLQSGFDAFENARVLPDVSVAADGSYRVKARR